MEIKKKLISLFSAVSLGIPIFLFPSYSLASQQNLEEIILLNSTRNQVVMFGEKHMVYRRDNEFVIRILPQLKKQGFEYFAFELDREEPNNQFRKMLKDYATGKLTRNKLSQSQIRSETIYATKFFDIVDSVKKEHMNIVCYDTKRAKSFNEQEKIAFTNLKELIFDKNPNAKVVIFCGWGHLPEKPTQDPWIKKHEKIKYPKINIRNHEYNCLGFYLNTYTQGKTLTVDLVATRKIPYCDLTLNLYLEK